MVEVLELEDDIEDEMEDNLEIEDNFELIPPKGSKDVGTTVATIFDEIISYRDEFDFAKRMTRYYNLRRNRHWKFKNTGLNLISANMLGTYHKKTVNQLTDNNPTFNAVPGGVLGEDAQDKLSLIVNITDTWWNDTEQQSVLEESVHTGELYGFVGEYVYPDQSINFPVGDISVDTLDPMYFSLYPPAERKVRKAEAFVRWYKMSVRKAKRTWPEMADQIVSDVSLKAEIGDERNDEADGNIRNKTQVVIDTVTKWIGRDGGKSSDTDSDDTYIIEVWVKDYSTQIIQDVQIERQVDELGREFEIEVSREVEVPVYPGNIRRIEVCNGGNVVLSDEYNPSLNPEMSPEEHQRNYLYSRFPISYIQPTPDPSSPFGLADYEQLEKLNTELDKALTQFSMFKDKASRMKLKLPKDSGVPRNEMDNADGIIEPTNAMVSQGIGYIEPPNMGTDIPAAVNIYKDLFSEVSGSFEDITQGQRQGQQVIAAQAIALLLEKTAMSISGKAKNYQKMIRERGRMFYALTQMWSGPRVITFQKNGEDQTIEVTRDQLQIDGKINVVSGSTMPVSNIQRREETLTLAQGGFVDQEYVLKKFDIDNYKDIILRMQQGPLGQYLNKLSLIGIPKEILSLFQQIGATPDKEVEKAIKEGKIPTFQQLIQQLMGQQQPEKPDPEMIKMQMDAADKDIKNQLAAKELDLKAQKTMSEIRENDSTSALNAEKIKTEMVNQQVKANGIKLDWENIKIEKAKAVAAIQSTRESQKMGKIKVASDIAGKVKEESLKVDVAANTDSTYRESGMVSNNEEI